MPTSHRLALLAVLLLTACDHGHDMPRIMAYYADIDHAAAGEELKAQLHDLIDDHDPLNYRELWDALAVTDADPAKAHAWPN